MNTRMRSPRYPGTPLAQAIDYIAKIHKSERTNPVDRAVAAQAMGYSGLSGRSAKVLADLGQYGLLDKGAKNEVRVSKRAVEILHPDTPESRRQSLEAAAFEPDLFKRISERFPEGRPSEAALRSYFVREEFTDAAIPSAIRAYMQTLDFIENEIGSESHSDAAAPAQKSVPDQPIKDSGAMQTNTQPDSGASKPGAVTALQMNLDWVNKRGWVQGHVTTREAAQNLIDFANAIMATLPAETREAGKAPDAPEKDQNVFE